MSERFDQLSARHRQLRLRSEVQRRELSGVIEDVKQRLSSVDQSVAALRRFVRHPAVIAGGVAFVAMIGPRRLLSVASRGAMWLPLARELVRAGASKR
jgi:hypothetical protein